MIYWFTGQPGSGKTTLAKKFEGTLIDGDDMRKIFDNKDYSSRGRKKNIRLAYKIAKFLHYQGEDVFIALVSPYRALREEFKDEMGEDIVEFYLHSERDLRKEYHVDYEKPLDNYIDVDTDQPIEKCISIIESSRLKYYGWKVVRRRAEKGKGWNNYLTKIEDE